jgi:hypothetical protein
MSGASVNVVVNATKPGWANSSVLAALRKDSAFMDITRRKERERNNMMADMRRKLDTDDDNVVSIAAVIEQARQTIANTLYECRVPDADASAERIQQRLTDALILFMHIEQLDNFRHDLDLLEVYHTIGTLRERWEAGERASRIHGRSRSDYFRNFCVRFADDFAHLRRSERELRAKLADPNGEVYCHDRLHSEIIDAAFDAALNLEVNFETVCFDIETDGLLKTG